VPRERGVEGGGCIVGKPRRGRDFDAGNGLLEPISAVWSPKLVAVAFRLSPERGQRASTF